jgi:hypothetical protein
MLLQRLLSLWVLCTSFEMRLPLVLCLPGLVLACTATFQHPLQLHDIQFPSPLDAIFDKKVEWALEHYQIPGLAVAVVGEETFSKVSNAIPSKVCSERASR